MVGWLDTWCKKAIAPLIFYDPKNVKQLGILGTKG
jgi:hypothetical protein